jgi:hypothetical protein
MARENMRPAEGPPMSPMLMSILKGNLYWSERTMPTTARLPVGSATVLRVAFCSLPSRL